MKGSKAMISGNSLFDSSEIVIDNFAGGGGASTGIEQALRQPIYAALNHDPMAMAMHRINHSRTRHHCEDIRAAIPENIAGGRSVGLMWLSPDCTHHSKARGGKPRDKRVRGLAWTAVHWANRVKPRVIMLENVEEFQTWGPLDRYGQPKKESKGQYFRCFVGALRRRGYEVEYKELRACDYGAPTIRKRFFMIARRDSLPIVWPNPSHGPGCQYDYVPVAKCIDFSLPCPSIFLTREQGRLVRARRPLSPSTLKRVAKGIEKYVLTVCNPFIVSLTHQGGDRVEDIMEPARTITAAHRGEKALVQVKYAYLSAALIPYYGNERDGQNIQSPCRTITTKDRFALAESFMDIEPLTPEKAEKARQVASWLRSQGVNIPGEFAMAGGLVICDIGLRMLRPEECFLAQGFPKDYVIDRGILVDGSERIVELNCADQMRMCGNSVPPPVVKALVEANYYRLPCRRNYRKAS